MENIQTNLYNTLVYQDRYQFVLEGLKNTIIMAIFATFIGIILGIISQRPSEISETSISQCNNFLIFKMFHPKDLEFKKSVIPNINDETKIYITYT